MIANEFFMLHQKFIKGKSLERLAPRTLEEHKTHMKYFWKYIEQYVRYKLNSDLASKLPNCEIIVGVNNMSCIDKELDIPIIILKNNKVFKYAVEVDGKQFHEEPKKKINDYKKNIIAMEEGYSIFRVKTVAYFSKDEDRIKRSKADEQVAEIISIIKNEVANDIIKVKNTNIL